jgi:hypothetical protein
MDIYAMIFIFLTIVAGLKAIEHRGHAPMYTFWSFAVYPLAIIAILLLVLA